MIKKILAAMLALFAAVAFAAVDANKATQAELEAVKGIGPSIATKILDERKKGSFKDWNDMVERVKGVGEGNAAKFSAEGLTVNGATFSGAAPAMKKEEKKMAAPAAAATGATTATAAAPAAKADDKKAAAMAAPAAKADKPMAADDKKAAAMKDKEDKKAAKAAAAEAKKKAADDKKMAKAAKAADAKASDAKK